MRLKDPCGLKLRPFGVYRVYGQDSTWVGLWGLGFRVSVGFGVWSIRFMGRRLAWGLPLRKRRNQYLEPVSGSIYYKT